MIEEEFEFEGICKTCCKKDTMRLCSKIPMNMTEDFSCEEYDHDGTCETCADKDCEFKDCSEVTGCCNWREN